MNRILTVVLTSFVLIVGWNGPLASQNVNFSTPFTSSTDSYYENIGVGFGFSIPGGRGPGSRVVGLSPTGQLMPNLVYSWGGGFGRNPGGFPPGGGGFLGFRQIGNDGGGFSLGLNFAKGSRRSIVSSTPSLTVQNGFGGSIFSGQVRPFVTGVVPIVGEGGLAIPGSYGPRSYYPAPMPVDNAVTRAINSGQLNSAPHSHEDTRSPSANVSYSDADSTAVHGDASVAALNAARLKKTAALQKSIDQKMHAADQLVEQNELSLARSKYREALRLAEDERLKQVIKSKISSTRDR